VAAKKKVAPVAGRLIKRYDNRKLYDPAARRYVTIADLARMVGRGEDVRVEDQRTGEDMTNVTLAQVVLEGLKQRTAEVPRQVLTRLIRLGVGAGARAKWTAPQEGAARARREAETIVAGLLSRGRLTLEEGLALRQEITESIHRIATEAQHGIEARLHGLIEKTAGGDAKAALDSLKERLLAFETYLAEPKAKKTQSTKTQRRR
jgi:polyhydroxyalkanoate synthesis repressor PhaR